MTTRKQRLLALAITFAIALCVSGLVAMGIYFPAVTFWLLMAVIAADLFAVLYLIVASFLWYRSYP